MTVTDLWRYPIKGLGFERLTRMQLLPGQTVPFDRVWALAHDAAKINWTDPEWASCGNFVRGARAPAIMAVSAKTDESKNTITLSHPDQPDLTINPDSEADANAFLNWVKPLCPPDRAQPTKLYKVPGRGLTDSAFPSVSINTIASLDDLSAKAGQTLTQERFRGNVWINDTAPWAEFDWIGKDIQIGTTKLRVVEPIERCNSILTDPQTGKRDLNTLKILNDNYGHQNFGILAEVIDGGDISIGEAVRL